MLMINRAIASVFFLFVASIYRQDNPLERPASDFDSKGVGLTETLLKFAHQQHLPIAIDYVDRASMDQPVDINLRNITVGRALDSMLSNGKGYSWRLRNGMVEITNRRASKRADRLLNTVIPVFEIAEGEAVNMASTMLRRSLQIALDPSLEGKGYGGSIMGRSSTLKAATLHNRTVREILSYIVLNSRAGGWVVAGPPECLGYTPYCGLWYMIEREPFDPSYKLLLQNILENL
jgi:hypothetical protein